MRQLKLESNRSHDLNVAASEVNLELGVNVRLNQTGATILINYLRG